MIDPYLAALRRRIDAIHPGANNQIERIDRLPGAAAKAILREVLDTACGASNLANITSARKLMLAMPACWLSSVLPEAIEASLDLSDEWEYRRLLEILVVINSEHLPRYLHTGMTSTDEAIREAAADMSSGDWPAGAESI